MSKDIKDKFDWDAPMIYHEMVDGVKHLYTFDEIQQAYAKIQRDEKRARTMAGIFWGVCLGVGLASFLYYEANFVYKNYLQHSSKPTPINSLEYNGQITKKRVHLTKNDGLL